MTEQLVSRLISSLPSDWARDNGLHTLALLRAGRAFDRADWLDNVREGLRNQPASSADGLQAILGRARIELELSTDSSLNSTSRQACERLVTDAPRTEDGLLLSESEPPVVKAESLFWSSPLLARAGVVFGDDRFLDDAARQLFGYSGHAQDAVTHLFFRAWNPVERSCDEVLDARSNGFAINALVDTLEYLPFEHHRRRAIQMILTYTASGLDLHQDADGSWHEAMDDEGSPPHPSATALLTAALARGIKLGLVQDYHRDCALRGWQAVQAKLDDADNACALLAAAAVHELIR
jgi:unsaturated rhamnogalacturonyl hydrolase